MAGSRQKKVEWVVVLKESKIDACFCMAWPQMRTMGVRRCELGQKIGLAAAYTVEYQMIKGVERIAWLSLIVAIALIWWLLKLRRGTLFNSRSPSVFVTFFPTASRRQWGQAAQRIMSLSPLRVGQERREPV